MAIFAISDLHMSLGTDKPMSVFGGNWDNYEEKLFRNWNQRVTENDTVIVNGDISWATYLENAVEDFRFINRLNGTKIISKGNHDYWWTTMKKQNEFLAANGFNTINFMQNNCFVVENTCICGTRGWVLTSKNDEDKKIYNRELERLQLSLREAKKTTCENIICALHYPADSTFMTVMENFGVKLCVYGHLHGDVKKNSSYFEGEINGTEYRLVSCDYLDFDPVRLV